MTHAARVAITLATALLATILVAPAAWASRFTGCYWPHGQRYVRVWMPATFPTAWYVNRAMGQVWNQIRQGQPLLVRTYDRTKANVTLGTYSQTGTVQNATTSYGCSPGLSMTASVRFNQARLDNLTNAEQAETSVHEFGHVLGMGHVGSGYTVMRAYLQNGASLPTAYDRASLDRLYPS